MRRWEWNLWYRCWNEEDFENNVRFIRIWNNEGSEPRSWIGRWKCNINNIHDTFYNTHYPLITMRYLLIVNRLVTITPYWSRRNGKENTKGLRRINMESFPLSDETRQNYRLINRWIKWYRCIFALKEVCRNLAGGGVDEKGVFWRRGSEQAKWVILWLTKMCRLFVERNEGSWVTRTW